MKILKIVLLGTIVFLFTGCGSQYNNFAKCLTDAGMVFYGSDQCGHCQDQKEMFGGAIDYIDFVNCDFSEECDEKDIMYYPSWAFDGEVVAIGVQSFEELAEISGCALPSEE